MLNKHNTALIPLEVWAYNSPELLNKKFVNIGLFAEGLIYYEKLQIILSTHEQFEQLVEWFVKQDKFDLLIELIENKVLNFFYYSFMSTAINKDGVYSIWNIQFNKANDQSDFIRLILYKARLDKYINANKRARIYNAIEKNLIDEASTDYEQPIEETRRALQEKNRIALLVQAFVDQVYESYYPAKSKPEIEVNISEKKPNGDVDVTYNFNLEELSKIYGNSHLLRKDTPLIGEAVSNRLIWTAQKYGWDLFLGNVMSTVVGNKLLEVDLRNQKAQKVIGLLQNEVEFPNIQALVNENSLDIDKIMEIRKNAIKFRNWLQNEANRDRNALIAYHTEVSKISGLTRGTANILNLFGSIVEIGVPIYAAIDPHIDITVAAAIAPIASKFVKNIGDSLVKEWHPIIFGNWLINKTSFNKTINQ